MSNFDLERLQKNIRIDVDTLKQIKKLVDHITPEKDAKLQKLITWLDEQPLLRQHKLLIFTQFSDTGEYLYENLQEKYRSLEFADSNRSDLLTVIRRFAPIANNVPAGKVCEPIHILVSTNVLSEGLDLQDADYILYYH